MSDEKGKCRPYNQDGSLHDCKKKNGSKQDNHSNDNGDNNNNDIRLEVFLKKLESIGITIDMNKLRNVN